MVNDKSHAKHPETEDIKDSIPSNAENEELIAEEPAADNVSEQEDDKQTNVSDSEAVNWQDKYVRLSAEFDNFRKRTLKEKMELITSGGEDVIKAILPVVDDFDRAIEAVEKSDDIQSARTGMALIRNKLVDVLKSKGVCEIEAIDQDMDTDLHEAVARFPSDEDKKGKVIDVVQKGYKLKDKVIRFCKVVVGE